MSVEAARQNIITENWDTLVNPETPPEVHGIYQGEAVKSIIENSMLSEAAIGGADIITIPKANLRQLVQRVRKESTIATTALYALLAEMPELDRTILPQLFEFLGELAALAGKREKEDDEELEENEIEEAWGRVTDDGRGSESDDSGSDAESGDKNNFEDGIYRSLGKLGNTADKDTAIAIARGYFEAKDASPKLLNALNAVGGEFYKIEPDGKLAQLAAAEESRLASATLETSPAAVRARYRKRLRERSNLGELFEELTALGQTSGFLLLFVEIGADLAGIGRQSDKSHLRSLTIELKKLWQLKSVYEETKELVRITEPHIPKSHNKPEPLKLTASLLHYCGNTSVRLEDARSLLGPLERSSLESQLVFANGLRDLHSRMPDGIWVTVTERLLQYNALGELCYRLTEAEERLYEETNS